MEVGKYDMLVQVAKLYDELERLRDENDRLRVKLQSYKVASGSGELTPEMLKVYEFGISKLFDECTNSWVSVTVVENPECPDEPIVETSFEDWLSETKSRRHYPAWMSDELFDEMLMDEAHARYEDKAAKSVEKFEEARC